nr:12119_t:CDS:2 [Entrophospora candida]
MSKVVKSVYKMVEGMVRLPDTPEKPSSSAMKSNQPSPIKEEMI